MRMKTVLFSCAALAVLGLGACNTTQFPYPIPSAESTVIDEKALYVAEAAYFGMGKLAEAAVDSGTLKGDRARQVLEIEQKAYQALVTARAAQATANSASYAEQTARVLDLIAQAQALIRTRE